MAQGRRRLRDRLLGVGRALLVLLAVVAWLQLAWPPLYEYADARPFSGERWYNPLQDVTGPGLRANFHAHTRAWGGLTNGEGSPEELRAHYRALDYDVIGITNYMRIEPGAPDDPLYVPAYEHGMSNKHRHQSAIGARAVAWLEYPVFQGTRHKQHVIELLREDARLVVLNHPGRFEAYTPGDLARISGYDALEVSSKYGVWLDLWDAALSAGRPVWGISSDDGHRVLERDSHSAIGWLVVFPAQRTSEGVLAALEQGRFYAVRDRRKTTAPELVSSRLVESDPDADGLRGVALRVESAAPVEEIRFVGQGGVERSAERGVRVAQYRLRPDDTYVRVELSLGEAQLYVNPVLRHSGEGPEAPVTRRRPVATAVVRVLGTVLLFGVLFVLLRPRGAAAQRLGLPRSST